MYKMILCVSFLIEAKQQGFKMKPNRETNMDTIGS